MTDIGQQLATDHRELEGLLRRLSDDAKAPEPAVLHGTWCELESRLLAHLSAEEQYLLPLLEAAHPVETAHILDEHKKIRAMLAELGVAIELHTARIAAIDQLIQTLQTHAAYEDRTLYPLAADKASSAVHRSVSAMLKSAVRSARAASAEVASGKPLGAVTSYQRGRD
jgi:iron-sulfur cluster repair protein YtfE (RIC family)